MIVYKILKEYELQLGSIPADCMVIFDIYPETGAIPHWPYDLDMDSDFYSEYEKNSNDKEVILYKTTDFPYNYIAIIEVPLNNGEIDIDSFEDMLTVFLVDLLQYTPEIKSIFMPYKSLTKDAHIAYGRFKTILSRMCKALDNDIVVTISNSV